MSNPDFGGPPGTNPPRYRRDGGTMTWAWVLSATGVIVVLLLVVSLLRAPSPRFADTPQSTTGQGIVNPSPAHPDTPAKQ